MGITLSWDQELDNLLIYKFDGKWTWQEFLLCFEEELEFARNLNGQRYDVLADTLTSQPLPPGSGISHVYGVFKRYPDNWGKTAIVTKSRFLITMLTVGKKVHADARESFVLAQTLDEARELIREERLIAEKNPR